MLAIVINGGTRSVASVIHGHDGAWPSTNNDLQHCNLGNDMRKIGITIAILFQFAVLFYMAAEREYIVLTGKTVYLRTAPIDPNDPFRGQFVRLNYEISTMPGDFAKDLNKVSDVDDYGRFGYNNKKETKVYTVLKDGENGIMELDYCTLEKPESGIFIRGRTGYKWGFMRLKYGIESYFVQEGRGKEIEEKAGDRNSMQIPMEMELALSPSGTAVIKGFRWGPLGIGIKILESPPPRNWANNNDGNQAKDDKNTRKSIKIMLTIKNASEKELAIVNLPDSRSFSLEPVAWGENKISSAVKFDSTILPTDKDVIVLEPGKNFYVKIDFADPRWFVETEKGKMEIGLIQNQWQNMFRIIYRPPSMEQCKQIENNQIIWHGYLQSRAFSGGGNID